MLARQLRLNEDEVRLVRLAALLHDLGHGPFSHVSENLLERYADRSSLAEGQKKEKIHELVTAHLIANDQAIREILGEDTCDQVVKLLSMGHGQPALKSIVSGPLDADKQDYLLRDGLFCGVEYGTFDIHQLHRSLVLHGEDDEKELMIDPDGVHAVEQYVLAKYYMTTNVYRRKVRLITDQMIVTSDQFGHRSGREEELKQIYDFDNSAGFFERYTAWNDARLLFQFEDGEKSRSWCGTFLRRLQLRRLHKRVYSEHIREFDPQVGAVLLAIDGIDKDNLRSEIESTLAKVLSDHVPEPVDALEVDRFTASTSSRCGPRLVTMNRACLCDDFPNQKPSKKNRAFSPRLPRGTRKGTSRSTPLSVGQTGPRETSY